MMRTTRLQLLQFLSGIVIVALLGIHILISHPTVTLGFFGVTDPTSWASVLSRARQGLWVSLYIALLAFVLYHALYGLRGIILEVTPSTRTERVITWAFIIIGILAFIWGSYVPVALLSS